MTIRDSFRIGMFSAASLRLAVGAGLLLALVGQARAENLVHNGDFELPAPENPPPGWSMWGAKRYKDPDNFALDRDRPHGGGGCLRIHHPKDSSGYIVTSPSHALRPKEGMAYLVSFWARTDRPGPSVFYLEAYSSLKPYRGAPSPGRFPFRAEPEWKRFTFEIQEGFDFRAADCRYVLLAFRPTMSKRADKTLWLDDVVVTERRSDKGAGLLDVTEIDHVPLEHRLRPGRDRELSFTVDLARRLRRAKRCTAGVSFHRVAGFGRHPYDRDGRYVLEPDLERAVRDMLLPMTRIYAVGAEPFGLESAIDKAAELLRRTGIPQETSVLELETQGASERLAPDVWARGVRHSLARGYGFRYWEVSNEPYTRKATAFAGPDDYVQHVKAVSTAIRKVQPEAQIGVGVSSGRLSWGSYVLKEAAGHYDFVVPHYYAGPEAYGPGTFETCVLTENFRKLDHALRVNALIKAYNPARDVYQYDTEWGMSSSGPVGGAIVTDRNANIMGALHRAVRLVYYAREDILRGASSWEMFCRLKAQGFGILTRDRPEARSYIYWIYYHFNRHVGEWVLETEGEAPWHTPEGADAFAGPLTPILATASEDGGTLYLVAVNGSWREEFPCTAELRGFHAASARGVVISSGDLDDKPVLERREDAVGTLAVSVSPGAVAFRLPAHSAVFVTVEGRAR